MQALNQLLRIASPPLSDAILTDPGSGHQALLARRNGFFAFESALLVLPLHGVGKIPGVTEWNASSGWRRHYSELSTDVVFFALDAFAGQFGYWGSNIVKLEPESGEVSVHSRSLEEWARQLLENYDYETGWSVVREWQLNNAPLTPGFRLLPTKPFVLGGDYDAGEMLAIHCVDAAEALGRLYEQIKRVPDGQTVTVDGWPQCPQ